MLQPLHCDCEALHVILLRKCCQFGIVNATFCFQTGKSKGYGFIEFEHAEVAKVAAETMNNYLMYEKLFKCK